MATDYYAVLGVKGKASEQEIRQAYRRLARKHHPDVNPGDPNAEERFKEINEAYQVLSDPASRKKYDTFGDNWKYAGQFNQTKHPGPFSWTHGTSGFGGLSDLGLGDLFSDVFGRREGATRGRSRSQRLEYPVSVTLEEALSGTKRLLKVQLPHGQKKNLEVKVPVGVDNGAKVRISAPGLGDVFLLVTVEPHDVFARQGTNLTTEVSTPLVDAVLGGEVKVPTLKGQVALTIPPESQNGSTFRLRSQGMPHLHKPNLYGDLIVRLKVVLPTALSEQEKKLFRELRLLESKRLLNSEGEN